MNIDYQISDNFIDYFFDHIDTLDRDIVCEDIIHNAFERWVDEMIDNGEGKKILEDIIDHL